MTNFANFILFLPPILAALTVHEYAHGWAAWKLGDSTAKQMGRLTLNPLAHLDPIGTILLFLVHFGWAKPVPVNPHNLRHPQRDMVWVSLAGPGANVLLALISGLALRFFIEYDLIPAYGPVYLMLSFTVFINLMLAIFNLVPIPPLDGSKVVAGFLPRSLLGAWEEFEKVGWLVLIGVILLGRFTGFSLFDSTIMPISATLYNLFTGGAPALF